MVVYPKRVIDGLLAATARVYHLRIATRNVRDFEGTGVEVVDPFQSRIQMVDRAETCGPKVRADTSPVRERTEGLFAGWEPAAQDPTRAEGPRRLQRCQ